MIEFIYFVVITHAIGAYLDYRDEWFRQIREDRIQTRHDT